MAMFFAFLFAVVFHTPPTEGQDEHPASPCALKVPFGQDFCTKVTPKIVSKSNEIQTWVQM